VSDYLTEIADTADELTNPMHIVERIPDVNAYRHKRLRRIWEVNLPSLLDQLAEAVVPGESYVEDEVTRGAFASRPAARLDAVDRLLAIEASAAMWCLGSALALRESATDNIRALVGKAPALDSGRQRDLSRDLRSWRTWAATVTGWEHPPHAPRAPCPLCEAKGTLRIRLEKSTGCCMACGAAWDVTNIGILTEHVKAYRARSDAAAEVARSMATVTRTQSRLFGIVGYEPRPDLPYCDAPTG
jgi:transcription elongation factor Elf1